MGESVALLPPLPPVEVDTDDLVLPPAILPDGFDAKSTFELLDSVVKVLFR